MTETFEEQLQDLVGEARKEGVGLGEIISALEVTIYALKEDPEAEEDE